MLASFKKITLSVFFFIVSLFVAESILRYSGKYLTYTEKVYNQFYPIYSLRKLKFKKNQKLTFKTNEYSYIFESNNIGFRGPRYTDFNFNNNVILFLGDSYVEGVGVPYQKSWIYLLSKTKKFRNYNLFNAGVRGSDVVSNLKLLKTEFLNKNIQRIILTINTTDISDIVRFGDENRFSSVNLPVPLYIYNLWKKSHFFRGITNILFGWNQEMLTEKQYNKRTHMAYDIISETLKKYIQLTKVNNIKFDCFIQPLPFEINKNLVNYEKLKFVLKRFNCVDLRPQFREMLKYKPDIKYYYAIDKHFNSLGYDIFMHIMLKSIKI